MILPSLALSAVSAAQSYRSFEIGEGFSPEVMRGASGTFCDDDSRGELDAEISGVFAPGQYEIYVGTNGDQDGAYTITLTEQ